MNDYHLTPIQLVPFDSQHLEPFILLNEITAKRFRLQPSTYVGIKIGKTTLTLMTQLTECDDNTLHICTTVWHRFLLPLHDIKLLACYVDEANTLLLGPIMAMMTEVAETEPPHFRSVHSFSEELHYLTQEQGGLFYVFHRGDFSVTSTPGYYYHDGNWVKHEFPPPDVIYNRIHSRQFERSKLFLLLKEQLYTQNIPFFNDRFLSKWEIHELLREETDLAPFIPKTVLFDQQLFPIMLNEFTSLYLKPIHGSQGRNIFQLCKETDTIMVKVSTGLPSDDYMSFSHLDNFFTWFKQMQKNRTYIIQQGIPLLLYKNRTIDFRVLCHQYLDNKWKVTSVVARISGEKQFVANIARGGNIMKPLAALSELYDKQTAQELLSRLKQLALLVATRINEKTTGITGELGLDIGLDQDGHPWLIEVNSKPSKNFEEQEVKVRPSTRAIIQFCTRLGIQHKHKELETGNENLGNHDTTSEK